VMVLKPSRSGVDDCLVNSGPQKPDLDEVIEMTGLKRSILAIVCETEELAGPRGQLRFAPQKTNTCQTQNCGRSASPFRTERCELGEIRGLTGAVRHTAPQAEAERR